jgi:hypothetical protein
MIANTTLLKIGKSRSSKVTDNGNGRLNVQKKYWQYVAVLSIIEESV